jgi:dihydrofolate reductase
MIKVFLIVAVTADGFIAQGTDELVDWTSKEDKKLFVELTKRAGVIIFGGNTFRTVNRALPGRRNIVYSHAKIDVEGVETTSEPPAELIKRLEREGLSEVAVCGGRAIYDLFLQAGVVDEMYLSVEPILFGTGISLLQTPTAIELTLLEAKKLNDNTMLLHYEVER